MDEEDLVELELHLAAGTDLPTAFAALPPKRAEREPSARVWWLVFAVVVAVLIWWLIG